MSIIKNLAVCVGLIILVLPCLGQSAWAHYAEGLKLNKTGKYEAATEAFGRAVEAYIDKEASDSVGFSYVWVGINHVELKHVEEARRAVDAAMEVYEASSKTNTELYYDILSLEARLELVAGNPDKARPIMLHGVSFFKGDDSTSTAMRASMYSQLAASYSDAGIIDSAVFFYEKSLELREQVNAVFHALAKSNINLGSVAGKAGDFDKRFRHYQKALDLYRGQDTLRFRNELLYAYNNLGGHFMEKGDYETALPYFQHALTITTDLYGDNHPTTANILNNIGSYHSRRHEHGKAIVYYEKAYPVMKNILGEAHPYTAFVGHNLGFAQYNLGQEETGFPLIDDAVAVLEKRFGPNFPPLANMYENLGKYWVDHDLDKGFLYLKRSRDSRVAKMGIHHPRQAQGLELLARNQWEAGRKDSAKISVQQGLIAACRTFEEVDFAQNPKVEDAISLAHVMRLLHLKATIQDDEGNYIASRATYSLAIESLNALRNQFYQAKGKANLQEEALSLLADAANSTWRAWNEFGKRADLEALYSVVQQGKSALLTDHLRNNRALRFGGLPESVLQQEQQLQSDLVFYQTKIAEERGKGAKKDSALLERWLGKSLSIETSQRQLAAQLEREYPAYFNLKYDTQTIDIQVIQSRMLGAEEAILECFIANETLYLFWIHRDEVQVRKLASDTIESLALSLHEALKKPGLPFESQSSQLYAKLLAPFIKEQIPGSIIVVPDGLLGYIPFEVLLTNAQPTSADYRSLPYLGKQSQVSYSYAVRLLLDGKRRSGNKKFAGFAPGYPPLSESNNESSALAGLVRDGLWELPGARREVEEIAALVDGTAFLGEEATESVFRSQAPQYGLLHLAMHALVDDQNPLQSYLVFTQNDQDEHDGLLHASELYSMNLPAQLAVLSACNTGYGSLRRGEGIMSLSRAFAYAGCPSTVMSLWQAPDKETGVLMEEFYQKLSQGLHKHDALQQAKLRYLEEAYTPALGHPFYWAGFIMSGDRIPVTSVNDNAWLPWGLALLIAVLITLRLRKKATD